MSLAIEIKGLEDELSVLIRKILREELERALKPATLSRSEISRELGRSTAWLSRNPWALPNYGKPDVAGSPELWWRETWEEWRKNLAVHKDRWEGMNEDERREFIKIA